MKKVVFKNVGKYLEEDSNRYEAIIDNAFKVRVYKDGYYEKGFIFVFLTLNDYSLDLITSDFLSNFWSKATKKEVVKRVKEIVNDSECYQMILNHVNYINKDICK